MLTVEEVFDQTVRPLPAKERLRLAAMILQDLALANVEVTDVDDGWSEQDRRELTTFSLQYAQKLYPEDEELV